MSIELEGRIARLERRVGELSSALLEQGRMVEDLQGAVEWLRKRNRELEVKLAVHIGPEQ